MKQDLFTILRESPQFDADIESLTARTFGPGRFARTAFRLRESTPHDRGLSFVALRGDDLAGSVRLTGVRAGGQDMLLLGPLVVAPEFKSKGAGAALMNAAVSAASQAGHSHIVLVGDLPYYERFGFAIAPRQHLRMPGPVDPDRLLVATLNSDCPLPEGLVEGS